MANLIIAEHSNGRIDASLRAVATAASQLGGETHVLVAGEGAEALAMACIALLSCFYLCVLLMTESMASRVSGIRTTEPAQCSHHHIGYHHTITLSH